MDKETLHKYEPHPILQAYEDLFRQLDSPIEATGQKAERTGHVVSSANLVILDAVPSRGPNDRTLTLIAPGFIHHPHEPENGQVWPGGAHEEYDETLYDTAEREAQEENTYRTPRDATTPTGILNRIILTPFQRDSALTTNAEAGFIHTDYIVPPKLKIHGPKPHFLLPPIQQLNALRRISKNIRLISPDLNLLPLKEAIKQLTHKAELSKANLETLQTLNEHPLYLFLFYLYEAIASYKLRYMADYVALAGILTAMSEDNPNLSSPNFYVPTQHVLYSNSDMLTVITTINEQPVEIRLVHINKKYYISIRKIARETAEQVNKLQRRARIRTLLQVPSSRGSPQESSEGNTLTALHIYKQLCKRLGLGKDCRTLRNGNIAKFAKLETINEMLILANTDERETKREQIKNAIHHYIKRLIYPLSKPSRPQLTEKLILTLTWMATHPFAPLTELFATAILEELSYISKLPPTLQKVYFLVAETFIL